MAAVAALVCVAPTVGHAALINTVTSGTASLPNRSTPTITKAFVVCSARTTNDTAQLALYTCDLNTGAAPRLTITRSATPGNTTTRVQYYVAEFEAGVSVQRGTATFSAVSLAPSSAPTLTAVDGSNGPLYQLSLTTGAIQKTLTVGGGTLSVGLVSFSPDRSLYQRFPGAFTANGRPLSVTNRLLVNGTAIVDAGLYGEWCVDLFLDQEEAPIFRRGFVLTAP